MGQDLGELCGLGIVHVGDTDALPVAQHGQHHLDAFGLQPLDIRRGAAVFEQVGHLVVQVERRLDNAVHRPLVDVRCEELHDVGIGLAIRKFVIPGVERVHVVGLDIDRDRRGLVPVSTCFDDGLLSLVHRRFLCLLAGEHHTGAHHEGCHQFKSLFHNSSEISNKIRLFVAPVKEPRESD